MPSHLHQNAVVGETELPQRWRSIDVESFHPVGEASPLENRVSQLSPAALAYLGDAVYELYVRTHFLFPPKRSSDYHQQVVARVRAEAQADRFHSLVPHLSAAELDIARRGRNATSGHPRRLDPKVYQQATSFETIVGYLYVTDPQRLWELLALIHLDSQLAP